MKQTNDTVAISGVAQSNERVSELLRNLSTASPWITRPDLVEIVAGNVALTPKDQRRVANFKVTVKVLRASEAAKAASAAASAASGAGATTASVPAPAPGPATVAATPAR
jgi:type IV pilus assembly protein PilN